ncbi:hypothetical protein POX_c04701 [Penicillium oxalicum]|nr:hypothetical protein POX_c04701 [Penicillium oxalicum]KAI2791822.1 hypothetical protein POX_c04701 [Penicillium oxalicum]
MESYVSRSVCGTLLPFYMLLGVRSSGGGHWSYIGT